MQSVFDHMIAAVTGINDDDSHALTRGQLRALVQAALLGFDYGLDPEAQRSEAVEIASERGLSFLVYGVSVGPDAVEVLSKPGEDNPVAELRRAKAEAEATMQAAADTIAECQRLQADHEKRDAANIVNDGPAVTALMLYVEATSRLVARLTDSKYSGPSSIGELCHNIEKAFVRMSEAFYARGGIVQRPVEPLIQQVFKSAVEDLSSCAFGTGS